MLLSDIYLLFSSLSCCLVHDNSKQDKDYALLLSFVGQARLQFAGLHSLFLALWCIVIERGGAMKDFFSGVWCIYILSLFAYADAFVVIVVSARLDIRCCRCFFDNWCICTALIFIVADAFFETDVSAACSSLDLQILFSLPIMYNCICNREFSEIEDTKFWWGVSARHWKSELRMHIFTEKHPHVIENVECRCKICCVPVPVQ